jgi:ABC-2 type transport system permease protein
MFSKYIFIVKNSFLENNLSIIVFLIRLLNPLVQITGYLLLYNFLTVQTQIISQPSQNLLIYYLVILVVSTLDLPRFGTNIQPQIASEEYLNIEKLPINPFIYYFLQSIGKNIIIFSLLLLTVLGYFIYIQLNILALMLFIPSVCISFFLAHLIFFSLTSFTFYYEHLHMWVFAISLDFLSGKLIPIYLLPAFLKTLLYILPFSYSFGSLATAYSTSQISSILTTSSISLLWCAILFKVAYKLWIHGSYYFQEHG